MIKYTCILMLILVYCKCEIFHFNATLECQEKDNCNFYQPEIWENRDNENSVPRDGDTVYLIGKNRYTIYIPEISHVMLELFYVSGNFTLRVINSSNSNGQSNNLELVAILLDTNSSLQVVSVGVNNTGTTQLYTDSTLSINSAIGDLILSAPGSGSIEIMDSNVRLTNPYMSEISETVVVGGNSTILIDGIKFNNSNLITVPGNITIIAQWMELNGNFSVTGQLFAVDFSHVAMNGDISFSGEITILGGTFRASGALTAGGSVVLDSGKKSTMGIFFAGAPLILVTSSLFIRQNGVFCILGPITIYGDVINNGYFYLSQSSNFGPNQNITILGNYSHMLSTAKFGTYLKTGVSASVNAYNINITEGHLVYTVPQKVPPHYEFTILQSTNQEISGKFISALIDYDDSRSPAQKMEVIYNTYSVVMVPIPESKFRWGVLLYIIFVVFIVILVVAIVAINWMRAKKRKDYNRLHPLQSIN